jgi:hypothetical protein
MKLVSRNNYGQYIDAEKSDAKIAVLLEARNTYRSFAALCLLLVILAVYQYLERELPAIAHWRGLIATTFLGTLFLISFIKQDKYIFDRMRAGTKDE